MKMLHQQCVLVITMILAHNKLANALPRRVSSVTSNTNRLPALLHQQHQHQQPQRAHQAQHPRLSLVEWDQYDERDVQGPNTYAFGYDVQDPSTDNIHFRHEERLPNGTVVGSYGYVTPDGSAHLVKYTADERGYRATIETTKRLADTDVKPIPVNVEQEIADEIASAELILQDEERDENTFNNKLPTATIQAPVAVYDFETRKYVTASKPPTNRRQFHLKINNFKEDNYEIRGNLATRSRFADAILPAESTQPSQLLLSPNTHFNVYDTFPFY